MQGLFSSKKNLLILTLLLTVTFYMMPQQKAEAIDPVTMAILAPIAIQGAKILAPYVIKAIGNMGKLFLRASGNLLETFLLPVGIIECTILAPWLFGRGCMHVFQGICGPLKFCGWM